MNKVFVVEKVKDLNASMTICRTGCSSNFEEYVTTVFPSNMDARTYIKSFLRKNANLSVESNSSESILNKFIDYLENIEIEELKKCIEEVSEENVDNSLDRFEILDL